MSSTSRVCFFFEYKKFTLKSREHLKTFIESVFRKHKKKVSSINYIFCSDKRLLEINRQFLGHDYYTDIITFDLSETDLIDAEVYISVERVKENARKLGTSLKSELHRVIFHGVLHLCGFPDKTFKQKQKMRQMEDLLLGQYLR
jgi:probable rRNA maturation factor